MYVCVPTLSCQSLWQNRDNGSLPGVVTLAGWAGGTLHESAEKCGVRKGKTFFRLADSSVASKKTK